MKVIKGNFKGNEEVTKYFLECLKAAQEAITENGLEAFAIVCITKGTNGDYTYDCGDRIQTLLGALQCLGAEILRDEYFTNDGLKAD